MSYIFLEFFLPYTKNSQCREFLIYMSFTLSKFETTLHLNLLYMYNVSVFISTTPILYLNAILQTLYALNSLVQLSRSLYDFLHYMVQERIPCVIQELPVHSELSVQCVAATV